MDDRVQQDDTVDLSGSPVRAKTIVIRCWEERDSANLVKIRGSVRDLTRGRAVAFEGFTALSEQLQLIIGGGEKSGSA